MERHPASIESDVALAIRVAGANDGADRRMTIMHSSNKTPRRQKSAGGW
jgi:hypothetical protein